MAETVSSTFLVGALICAVLAALLFAGGGTKGLGVLAAIFAAILLIAAIGMM